MRLFFCDNVSLFGGSVKHMKHHYYVFQDSGVFAAV